MKMVDGFLPQVPIRLAALVPAPRTHLLWFAERAGRCPATARSRRGWKRGRVRLTDATESANVDTWLTRDGPAVIKGLHWGLLMFGVGSRG